MTKAIKATALPIVLALYLGNVANAGEVTIVAADFQTMDGQLWSIQVTLQHTDTGWDHYADRWRVVDSAGQVVADRILYHPHVDEQPFTRGLRGVALSAESNRLYVAAHDNVHGWAKQRLQIDLSQAVQGRLQVPSE